MVKIWVENVVGSLVDDGEWRKMEGFCGEWKVRMELVEEIMWEAVAIVFFCCQRAVNVMLL